MFTITSDTSDNVIASCRFVDDAYKVAEALGAGHIIWHQGARVWYVGHASSVAVSFEAAQPTIIARLAA